MLDTIRRLHPRGAANRGICVDADGAMLGPDCVLVSRTSQGFRPIARDDAAVLQKGVLPADADPDWLFQQCQRIADALNHGELALAQIYGLRIPIADLADRQLRRSAAVGLAKTGFNPDEPRLPKGDPHGGEWTTGGGNGGGAVTPANSSAPLQLLADLAVDGGGRGGQTAAPSDGPPMSYRMHPPGSGTAQPPARAPDLTTGQTTLDSPDLQPDPTSGAITLDSPDLQLDDVLVTADAPEENQGPTINVPGIGEVDLDDITDLLLFLASRGRLAPSSRGALRRLLRALGLLRKEEQAHHIVPKLDRRTDPARKVLERFGIGIHDPVNGVGLPPGQHSKLGADAYHEFVNRMLAGAGSRAEAEGILQSIARMLKEGDFPWAP
jgi:hypothetical protein